MGGGILFALVSVVAFLSAEFLTGTEMWLAGFLLIVLLAIALRNGWAIVLANRYQLARSDHPRLVVYREWKETRRWSWILLIAAVVASALAGVAMVIWGGEEVSSGTTTEWLWIGTVGTGVAIRWFALALAMRTEANPESSP